MFRTWWRRGREPDAGSIVPRWHEPEGRPSRHCRHAVDQSADMDDIVATLLDLAVRGYLVIQVRWSRRASSISHSRRALVPRQDVRAARALGHRLGDRADEPSRYDDLARYEREVLDGVLEGGQSRRMSDLTNDFYKHIPGIDRAMYDEVVLLGLFEKSPDGVRKRWALIGGAGAGGRGGDRCGARQAGPRRRRRDSRDSSSSPSRSRCR